MNWAPELGDVPRGGGEDGDDGLDHVVDGHVHVVAADLGPNSMEKS